MYTLDDFLHLLEEMICFFSGVTRIQKEKITAATQHDILKIEDCMKQEQAYLLKFRGLDKKRTEILSDLSLEHKTLQEIIAVSDEIHKGPLSETYQKLNAAVRDYRSTAQSAKNILETNLYRISKTVAELEHKNHTDSTTLYSPNGHVKPSPGTVRFSSRKV